jgi:hypothetical protein
VAVHNLSRAEARRIAVRAQLLESRRPAGLLDLVRHLTLLQIDPTAVVAPSADLVVWSRLGSSYAPAELETALEERTLLELRAMIRPSEDLALYRAEMAEWPGHGPLRDWQEARHDWVRANDACRRDILDRLRSSGPLPSRHLPDGCEVPWASSGWTNNRNVTQLLESMVLRGEVAVAGRDGRERLWDLASRVYPDEPPVPAAEARRIRNERRLRALGIARARGPESPVEPVDVGEAGEEAVVEGVKGPWRVDPPQLDRPFCGGAALRRPKRRRAPGNRRPPGRALHGDDDRRGRPRDRGSGPLARPRPRTARLNEPVEFRSSGAHDEAARSTPNGIRTRVAALKGRRPWPLADGGAQGERIPPALALPLPAERPARPPAR